MEEDIVAWWYQLISWTNIWVPVPFALWQFHRECLDTSWLFFKTSHFQITTPSAGQWVTFTLRKPQQQYWKCSLHYIVSTLIDQQQHSQLLPNDETIVSRLVRFRRFHQVRHSFGSATCRHFHTMEYTLFRSRDSHTMHSQPLGQDLIDNQKPKFVIRVEGWFDHI